MKNKKLNVMAIQMSSVIGDKQANIEKVKNLIETNITNKIDIIFLPEVWSEGWDCNVFPKLAEDFNNHSVIKFLSEIAKKYNVNIIGGSTITKKCEKLYNTCPVINRNGELIGTYNKCHLFTYLGDTEGLYITHGENPVIVTLEGIRIGLSICYDIRFPEIYRSDAFKGVDMLVNMAAWPMTREIPWVSLTHARAVENQSYFVALTQSGQLSDGSLNLGKSTIHDYKGDNLAQITSGEGAICAELDFEKEYEFREQCTVLKDVLEQYEVKEI